MATIFFLFSIASVAQQNFAGGYIVTLRSDTVKGFVNDKQWVANPVRVAFKPNLSAESKTYLAKELKGYYTDYLNEYYESSVVSIDKTPYELNELLTPKEIGRRNKELSVTDTVF